MRPKFLLACALLSLGFTLSCTSPSTPPTLPDKMAVRVMSSEEGIMVVLLEKGREDPLKLEDSFSPAFSRDGSELYFAQVTPFKTENYHQIKRLELLGRQIVTISDGTAADESPAPAPTDLQVAFVSHPVGLDEIKSQDPSYTYWRLMVMDRDGKNRRFLDPEGPAPQLEPSWSPDCSTIAYVYRTTPTQFIPPDVLEKIRKKEKISREVMENVLKNYRSTIMLLDLSTGKRKELLPPEVLASYPCWSPKGDLIAFTSKEKPNKTSIWVVKPDGTDLRPVTSGTTDDHPSWTPDGQSLMFSRQESDRRVIYEVSLKTFKERKLLESVKGVKGIDTIDFPRAAP
jgi:Tol biopolymer transport system component